MTRHTATRWSTLEKIAGLDRDGQPFTTQCGIEFWDLTTPDVITKDTATVDCPGCLAPTPIEQEVALREYLEQVSVRGPYEANAGWALRVLKERAGILPSTAQDEVNGALPAGDDPLA